MELVTTTILITFGLILMTLGYVFNRIKNFLFLPLAGSTLLIIIALLLFTNPIQYESGTISNITGNITITEFTYTDLEPQANSTLAWVLMLTGLINIIIISIMMYDRRFEEVKSITDDQ